MGLGILVMIAGIAILVEVVGTIVVLVAFAIKESKKRKNKVYSSRIEDNQVENKR